jgi:integrase/recombinase XerD
MTDMAISLLRRRMIEGMTKRQLKPATQHNYIRFVKEFSIFRGRSPDKAAFEDVRRYQLHSTSRDVSPGSINGAMAALNFFFRITVQRFDIANYIQLVRQPRRLPVVLSPRGRRHHRAGIAALPEAFLRHPFARAQSRHWDS